MVKWNSFEYQKSKVYNDKGHAIVFWNE